MLNNKVNRQLILVTSGDPAGVGPDICLDIAGHYFDDKVDIVVLGDIEILQQRARLLERNIPFRMVTLAELRNGQRLAHDKLNVYDIKSANPNVTPGYLDQANAQYVLNILDTAIDLCKQNLAATIVTAPLNKEIINRAGNVFTGHTEYLATAFGCSKVVMVLANKLMKVASLTTHIPLAKVPSYVTVSNLNQVLGIIITDMQQKFGISNPRIGVCGLNPHAGEGGYLGDEEIKVINPVIKSWHADGYNVTGSYPADTIFTQLDDFDLILAMYHDQGLPVLKYSGFEEAINLTLGLPIIRTSVDHGTALGLAGKGTATSTSLINAIKMGIKLYQK